MIVDVEDTKIESGIAVSPRNSRKDTHKWITLFLKMSPGESIYFSVPPQKSVRDLGQALGGYCANAKKAIKKHYNIEVVTTMRSLPDGVRIWRLK